MVMLRRLGTRAASLAYHPDGTHLAVGLANGGLAILRYLIYNA